MEDETLHLFGEELEMDNPDAKKKERPRVNCLQEMLLELMDERKVSLSQIQKATGIPWGSLMDWHNGTVRAQMADKNLLKLGQFFNVSLYYLLYGIGDDRAEFDEFSESTESDAS